MRPPKKSGREVKFRRRPYLVLKDVEKAIEFYRRAFDARGLSHRRDSTGRTILAEIQIGDTPIILSDEQPEMLILSPESFGGTPVALHLFGPDADRLYGQALRAGARVVRPMKNQLLGERCGSLRDPFGHHWHITGRVKDLDSSENRHRVEALVCGPAHHCWR